MICAPVVIGLLRPARHVLEQAPLGLVQHALEHLPLADAMMEREALQLPLGRRGNHDAQSCPHLVQIGTGIEVKWMAL
jgi:hypothetical protein